MVNHPFDVLKYAVRHGFDDISNAASPYTMNRSPEQVIPLLPPHTYIAWVRFLQFFHLGLVVRDYDQSRNFARRLDILHTAHTCPPAVWIINSTGGHCRNACWTRCYAKLMFDMRVNPDSLRDMSGLLRHANGLSHCHICHGSFVEWKTIVEHAIKALPSFSSLLVSNRPGRSLNISGSSKTSPMKASTLCG
jgi:hypothetical protein